MTPVAGAVIPMAALGLWEAEAEAAAPDDDRAEVDRLVVMEADRDMVVGADMADAEEEASDSAEAELAPSMALSVGLGAAPAPFPDAETAPSSAASPVAAAPPPVAVRVGAW
jgi:hypothetical protein